ncbi:MAG: hypothetical protein KatS3mg014_0891 [Actinomycetota bacterium]|nr:MAG: hypothetical protein KatS3mg014_0891 [Actinomycetota bacterium]
MPETAAALGVDPRDPLENLEGGARYLAEQIRRFGSVELGLAAYQAGPAAVSAAGGIPSAGTRAYVERVLGYAELLGAPQVAPQVASRGGTELGRDPRRGCPGARRAVAVAGRAGCGEGRGGPLPATPGARSMDRATRQRRRMPWTSPARRSSVGRSRSSRRCSGPVGPRRAPRTAAAGSGPCRGWSRRRGRSRWGPVGDAGTTRGPAVRQAGMRVVELVEGLRDATPPRHVAVELPELGGLRLLVEARGTTIHVRPLGGDPVWFDALLRDLGPGLAARGFDLADRGGSRPRGRCRIRHRRRGTGVRAGARARG